MSRNQPKYMPVFSYPGGNNINVSNLPSNTAYKWIDGLGGGHLSGPAIMGEMRPDGKPGHGGVATYSDGFYTVEYHGINNNYQNRSNHGYGF